MLVPEIRILKQMTPVRMSNPGLCVWRGSEGQWDGVSCLVFQLSLHIHHPPTLGGLTEVGKNRWRWLLSILCPWGESSHGESRVRVAIDELAMETLSCCLEMACGPDQEELAGNTHAQHGAQQPASQSSKAHSKCISQLLLHQGCLVQAQSGAHGRWRGGLLSGSGAWVSESANVSQISSAKCQLWQHSAQARKWKRTARWWDRLLLN